MDSFNTLEELKQAFVSGNYKFSDSVVVAGVEFRQNKSAMHSLEDIMNKGYKPMMIFAVRPTPENKSKLSEANLNEWIVFLWGMNNKYHMLPYDVRTITRSRQLMTATDRDVSEGYKDISQDRVIPDKVSVMLLDLPVANELVGKVDTGADICSLHAENIEVNRELKKVSFDCPQLSSNRITVPLVDQQAVKTPSAEGTVYRPVIALNIKVAHKSLKDVRINLNDRGQMEQPFLIGQNALEAGSFIIDPNIIKEDLDDETFIQQLTEEFSGEVIEETTITEEDVAQLFDLFESTNISFKDLIKVLRTETINRMNKVDY